jgi:hypothetical protein
MIIEQKVVLVMTLMIYISKTCERISKTFLSKVVKWMMSCVDSLEATVLMSNTAKNIAIVAEKIAETDVWRCCEDVFFLACG